MAFALTCAVAGPVLTTLTVRWPRRTVLASAMLLYIAGAAGTALASSYPQVLLAQPVAAAGVGLFVPSASLTAAALVPAEQRGRAIAIVVTGFTAAMALGAPIGTAMGGLMGWRSTMWFTAALAVPALVGILAIVPRHMRVGTAGGFRERLRPLAHPPALAVLATTLVGFTAVFVPYTYIGVIFEPATAGSGVALATLMFTLGVVGAVGNLGAGALADRISGPQVVAIALGWLAAGMVLLPLTTASFPAAVAMVAVYAVAAFAITTPQQHRLIALDPDSAAVLLSLNQAVLYLAIAASGMVGGLGIEWIGARHVSLVAAVLAVAALGLSELGRRLARNSTGDRLRGRPRDRRQPV